MSNRTLRIAQSGRHGCEGCGRVYEAEGLKEIIHDLAQRVEPGGVVPSGECPDPDCSALCYPADGGGKAQQQHTPALILAARCALADLEGVMPEFEPSGDREHPGWKTIEELRAALAPFDGAPGESYERLRLAAIAKARELYTGGCGDNSVEVDDAAVLSDALPSGVWVGAWVWVNAEELPKEFQGEGEEEEAVG